MLILFFTKSSFGKSLLEIEDLYNVNEFFQNAVHGIKITSNPKEIIETFQKLKESNKIERIALFLNILNLIILAEKQPLSSFVYRMKYTDGDGKRMGTVIEHAMEHYYEHISLDEIAEKANMSKKCFLPIL